MERLPDIRLAVVCEHRMLMQAAGNRVKTPDDSHAGEIETSRMLHSCAERVRPEFGTFERPAFPPWELVRGKQSCWPGGVWGDPSKATSEKGRVLEEAVVAELVALIDSLRGDAG